YHDLVFVDRSAPGPGTTVDFAAGQLGLFLGIPSTVGTLADAQFEWDVVPLPAGPAGERATFGAAGWVAFSGSKNPELATEYVKFVTNPENRAAFAGIFLPPRGSLLDPALISERNGLAPEVIEETIVKALEEGTTMPQLRGDFASVFIETQSQ